jgi:putative transposase
LNRVRHFANADAVTVVQSQIVRAAAEERFAFTAYCFMPDHVHLLVEGESAASDCKRFIARAKQYSGFYFARAFRTPLWQRYGFERVLRECEPTITCARYIVANPVRAGLATSPLDYPHWGSSRFPREALIDAIEDRRSG